MLGLYAFEPDVQNYIVLMIDDVSGNNTLMSIAERFIPRPKLLHVRRVWDLGSVQRVDEYLRRKGVRRLRERGDVYFYESSPGVRAHLEDIFQLLGPLFESSPERPEYADSASSLTPRLS